MENFIYFLLGVCVANALQRLYDLIDHKHRDRVALIAADLEVTEKQIKNVQASISSLEKKSQALGQYLSSLKFIDERVMTMPNAQRATCSYQ